MEMMYQCPNTKENMYILQMLHLNEDIHRVIIASCNHYIINIMPKD